MSLDVLRSKGACAPSHTEVYLIRRHTEVEGSSCIHVTEVQLIDHVYDGQASAQHVCDEIVNVKKQDLDDYVKCLAVKRGCPVGSVNRTKAHWDLIM